MITIHFQGCIGNNLDFSDVLYADVTRTHFLAFF